jgi:hypothetical protein
MSYVGNVPTTAAFPFDQFSGNGSTTAFTLSYAPAGTTSIIVSISGVVQNPNTYSVSGTTLTFTPAPPTGTSNIAVLYLGLPVVATLSPGNTAYFSSSVFTATASQTVFTPSGTYQAGFINVIRNGSQLAPADYTATNGTTVTLASACTAGDTVVIEVFNLTSLTGALPLTGGTVTGATTFNSTLSVNGANVSGFTGFKNRIINPEMDIDQRNAGASVTINTSNPTYTLDRWGAGATQNAKFTVQQNAGSVTPPAGFINYLGVTSSSAYSVLAGDYFYVGQRIEGFNIADLGWGTVNAATVTLSFWVRSSLTGTFGGALVNDAYNRGYPFSYSISAANTWEQKTITIVGDTTGTWLTTNGLGIVITFGLGVGATNSGTAGAWAAAGEISATGATSVVGTNGATFYITGVQLERGSNATSFEFRDYGRELILCQRYLFRINGASEYVGLAGFGSTGGGTGVSHPILFPVQLRATPTLSVSAASDFRPINDTSFSAYSALLYYGNNVGGRLSGTTSGVSNGSGVGLYAVNSTGWINFSAEL